MTTDTSPAFSSLVKIPHDGRFIPMARAHVENLARMAGADGRETDALATEESLAFIIAKYPDSPFGAHVEIGFSLGPEGEAAIDLVDIGPPIRADKIPDYDVNDESSQAGLWYHLVEAFADEVAFTRKDTGGWLIHIAKRLAAPAFDGAPLATPGDDEPEAPAAKTGHRMATPGDAPALVDLIYKTYRYSYIDVFYDESVLAQLVASGEHEYLLVERGDEIIVSAAVKYSYEGRVGEIGAAMVAPDFRGAGGAVRRAFVNVSRYVRDNPRGCEFFFTGSVTSHDRSQRMMAKVDTGFRTGFLFLNMFRRFSFIGLGGQDGGFESPVNLYLFKEPPAAKAVYAPAAHKAMVEALLDNLDIPAEVPTHPAERLPAHTALETHGVPEVGYGQIDVATPGEDLPLRLAHALMRLMEQGIEGVNVNIATDAPLPPTLDADLAALFLVFSGVSFHPGGKVMLAYCLALKPVDFDEIRLSEPVAQDLLEHIKTHYARLGSRG